MNKREGFRRIVLVVAAAWGLYWLFQFVAVALDYYTLASFVAREPTFDRGVYEKTTNEMKARMFEALIYGGIIPAVVFFVGRYIVRGFHSGPI